MTDYYMPVGCRHDNNNVREQSFKHADCSQDMESLAWLLYSTTVVARQARACRHGLFWNRLAQAKCGHLELIEAQCAIWCNTHILMAYWRQRDPFDLASFSGKFWYCEVVYKGYWQIAYFLCSLARGAEEVKFLKTNNNHVLSNQLSRECIFAVLIQSTSLESLPLVLPKE